MIGLLGMTALILGLQFPAVVSESRTRGAMHAQQMETLHQIVETDRLCVCNGISAAVACEALQPFNIPHSGNPPCINGWELLRGSPVPRAMSTSEARSLLNP